MKKTILLSFVAIFLMVPFSQVKSETTASRLKGRILLQVESHGEAWYVNPENKERRFLGRPDDAFNIMREVGVGISNNDLDRIPIAFDGISGEDLDKDGLPDAIEVAIGTNPNNKDSDSDNYNDYEELLNQYNPLGQGKINFDSYFSEKQSGKILLQVEKNGEAWYVNPGDNKRYFMGRPNDAYNLMRKLGLGISNSDLESIPAHQNLAEENNYITEIINFEDPLTGEELPSVTMRMTQEVVEVISEKQVGIISIPSIISSLLEKGTLDSDPKMRVIGPSYQISPQGENFGGVIDFSFCYFDEDIRDYNESLFYIGKENNGVWENIGGIPNPENNCVNISLESAPDYTIAVYAGVK